MTFTIRPAETGDITDIARIHIEGWRAAYAGLVDQAYLNALDQAEKEKSWTDILAKGESVTLLALDAGGRAAGFASYGRLRTPPPGMSPIRPLYSGELYAIYLLPDYWRQGLGRQLLTESAKGLRAQKHKSMCLWVMDKNDRANAFYKSLGGQRIGKKQVEIGGRMLPEAAYGWRDTSPLTG